MASSPAKNKISVSSSSLLSSSSPSLPSRSKPKLRNSETGDLMRRSIRGNPFPAPADSSRRNSIGKECSNRVEFGDKENQNEKALVSNVVNKGQKNSKHFMSPTISAVSKINPSPRKRVLSDKNEVSRSFDRTHHQVKSSVSFSDVISIIGEDKDHDEICVEEKKQLHEEESHDLTATDFDENLETKSNDDASFKISPLPPSVPYRFPVFESHEVDPMVAPYDPKKNYLSPRPQFLHYKPNPRIEHHFDECKQLEELFISESSSSDTDLSAEESQQEEEFASQEAVVAVEEEAEEILDVEGKERLKAAESDDEEEEVGGDSIEEEVGGDSIEEEETHQISKQSCFKMSKLLSWISVLGVTYLLLVSTVTITQPDIIKDSPFYQFQISTEITKSARESFEQVSVKLVMWAESSLVYMDKVISSLGEEERYGTFQFHNLTDLLEDKILSDTVFQPTSGEISVAGLLVDSQDWSLEMDTEEENVGHHELEEPNNGGEISLEAVYEEDGDEVERESEGGEVNSEMVYEFDEQAEIKIATDTEVNGGERYSESLSEEGNGGQETDVGHKENDQKNIEEGHKSETGFAQNYEKNMEESESNVHQLDDVESATISGHQQKETEVANAETISEVTGVGKITGNSLGVSEEATDVEHDGNEVEEESGFGEVVNDAGSEGILLSNQKKVVVVFTTLMVLLAAAGFLLAKKKTKPVKMQREDCEPTTISATKVEHVSVENLIKERLSSLNFKEEEEVGDERERDVSSFPSEMSFSFSKNQSLHSCSNNRDDLKEYQSGGGGKKSNDSGESMASSASEYSIGSVSYGSFTTYEKIQKRSGHKEKEMITPVRRSSRIRNHQHSGQ